MHKDNNTTHLHCVHSDDKHTIDERLQVASTYCRSKGVRFTELRRQVYSIILRADRPLGAYDVLGQLQQARTEQPLNSSLTNSPLSNSPLSNNSKSASARPKLIKPVAPPTVYRTLEFLLKQGFIHQLTSINAFVPCCHPRDKHVAAFLICTHCGRVQECSSALVQEVVSFAQQTMDFAVANTVMELSGICQYCQKGTDLNNKMDSKTCK